MALRLDDGAEILQLRFVELGLQPLLECLSFEDRRRDHRVERGAAAVGDRLVQDAPDFVRVRASRNAAVHARRAIELYWENVRVDHRAEGQRKECSLADRQRLRVKAGQSPLHGCVAELAQFHAAQADFNKR
jgi:hypothetical protein